MEGIPVKLDSEKKEDELNLRLSEYNTNQFRLAAGVYSMQKGFFNLDSLNAEEGEKLTRRIMDYWIKEGFSEIYGKLVGDIKVGSFSDFQRKIYQISSEYLINVKKAEEEILTA